MFLLPESYWVVAKTEKKGRGVFARKDIAAGTVIGDYLGKLIHDDDDDELQEEFGFYSLSYVDDAVIWPDTAKPGVYLLNHSCTPNTYMYTYQGHTLYFALRKIFAGEEITVSYLMMPADEDCDPCEHECHCNSPLCTGTMHMTQESYEAWKAWDDEVVKDFKIPPITYGKDLPRLDSYPETIDDHPVFPLYGTFSQPALELENKELPSQEEIRKLIREEGRQLLFKNIKTHIFGIADNKIVSKAQ